MLLTLSVSAACDVAVRKKFSRIVECLNAIERINDGWDRLDSSGKVMRLTDGLFNAIVRKNLGEASSSGIEGNFRGSNASVDLIWSWSGLSQGREKGNSGGDGKGLHCERSERFKETG